MADGIIANSVDVAMMDGGIEARDGFSVGHEIAFTVLHAGAVSWAWSVVHEYPSSRAAIRKSPAQDVAWVTPDVAEAMTVSCLVTDVDGTQHQFSLLCTVDSETPSTPVYGKRLVRIHPDHVQRPSAGAGPILFQNSVTDEPSEMRSDGTVHLLGEGAVNAAAKNFGTLAELKAAVWSGFLDKAPVTVAVPPMSGVASLGTGAGIAGDDVLVTRTTDNPVEGTVDNPTGLGVIYWTSGTKVANLAALALISVPDAVSAPSNTHMVVQGAVTPGVGGGPFDWVAESTNAHDGGVVVNPTGRTVAGRWHRCFTGAADNRWHGVVADGTTDNAAAIAAASVADNGPEVVIGGIVQSRTPIRMTEFPPGKVATASPVSLRSLQGLNIRGHGQDITRLMPQPGTSFDTLLNLDGLANGLIENLSLSGDPPVGRVDKLLHLHWDPTVASRSTTNNVIRKIAGGGYFRLGFCVGVDNGTYQCDGTTFYDWRVDGVGGRNVYADWYGTNAQRLANVYASGDTGKHWYETDTATMWLRTSSAWYACSSIYSHMPDFDGTHADRLAYPSWTSANAGQLWCETDTNLIFTRTASGWVQEGGVDVGYPALWQAAVQVGEGIAGNNLCQKFVGGNWVGTRFGLVSNAVNVQVDHGSPGNNGWDISIYSAVSPNSYKDIRSEGSLGLLQWNSGTAWGTVSLTDAQYNAAYLRSTGYWIFQNAATCLILDNVCCYAPPAGVTARIYSGVAGGLANGRSVAVSRGLAQPTPVEDGFYTNNGSSIVALAYTELANSYFPRRITTIYTKGPGEEWTTPGGGHTKRLVSLASGASTPVLPVDLAGVFDPSKRYSGVVKATVIQCKGSDRAIAGPIEMKIGLNVVTDVNAVATCSLSAALTPDTTLLPAALSGATATIAPSAGGFTISATQATGVASFAAASWEVERWVDLHSYNPTPAMPVTSGLISWHRGDLGAHLPVGKVDTWDDLSSLGHDAVDSISPAVDRYRPYVTTTMVESLRFNGIDQGLQLPDYLENGAKSWLVAFKLNRVPSSGEVFSLFTIWDAAHVNYTEFLVCNLGGFQPVSWVTNAAHDSLVAGVGINATLDTDPHAFLVVFDGVNASAPSSWTVTDLGVSKTVVASGNFNRFASDEGSVGARIASSGLPNYSTDGYIADLAVWSRTLSGGEQTSVNSYATTRY